MHTKHRILILSNDNFILGLFEGYCAVNNLILEVFSNDTVIKPKDINKEIHLIVLDARKPVSILTKSNLSELHKISFDFRIPVCLLAGQNIDDLKQTGFWVEGFFQEPFIDSLDNYCRVRFKYNPHPFPERRDRERRGGERRHVQSNHHSFDNSLVPGLSVCPDSSVTAISAETGCHYHLGPFKIDINCNSVSLLGVDLSLTFKEFRLFSLLATDTNRVFSADEIIEHLWPETNRANKSDLYQYMHLLRKKIEKDPENPHWILTVKRVGYRLNLTSALNS